jgi:hypothetical protein
VPTKRRLDSRSSAGELPAAEAVKTERAKVKIAMTAKAEDLANRVVKFKLRKQLWKAGGISKSQRKKKGPH